VHGSRAGRVSGQLDFGVACAGQHYYALANAFGRLLMFGPGDSRRDRRPDA
jgi:hypothetical protein